MWNEGLTPDHLKAPHVFLRSIRDFSRSWFTHAEVYTSHESSIWTQFTEQNLDYKWLVFGETQKRCTNQEY